MSVHTHSYATTEEWLALRDSMEDRLGGSELGVAAGHSKYNSPYAMFCQKVGLIETPDISQKESIIQGHDLEQYVAERFTRLTGRTVHEEKAIFTNDALPHLKATPDRLLDDGESGLECKTVKDIVMSKFAQGDFPQTYYDQCACYLAVTERKRWYLAMLVFGSAFKVFEMTTDKSESDAYAELLRKRTDNAPLTEEEEARWNKDFAFLEALYYLAPEELQGCEVVAAKFMERVKAFKEGNVSAWPIEEIDGSDATTEALAEIGRVEYKPESVVTLDSAIEIGKDAEGKGYTALDLVTRHEAIAAEIKAAEEQLSVIENQMAAVMNTAETAFLPGWKVTYKMSAPRATSSAKAVEAYFTAHQQAVPEGLIKLSDPKRGIRFWHHTEKPKKAKKSA